jgi:hypothetical protein
MEELATRVALKEYIENHINDEVEGGITAEEVRTAMLGIVENSMRVNNSDYTGNRIVISDNEGFVIESDYTTDQLDNALGNVVVYTAGEGIDISESGEISIDDTQLNKELEENYEQLNPDNLSVDGVAGTFCAHPRRLKDEPVAEGEDPTEKNNLAAGNYSTAFGFECKAYNGASNSFVAGDKCEVSHADCFVAGEGLRTAYDHQTIFGKYNIDSNYDSWGNKKPLFFIGGGTETNRATLLAQQGNNGDLCCAGGFANNAGFDFAEYFEWVDGNQEGKDRIGYMVKLTMDLEKDKDGNPITDEDGNYIQTYNKIEFANSFDECIGVTTSTYGFVCDSQVLDWQGKYVKDEFGRPVLDESDNLQISEDYDVSQEYVPREFRNEWTPVGMMGKILTRQDGSLVVGGFAGCDNGVATNATDRGYRVLKVINENVALLLVK